MEFNKDTAEDILMVAIAEQLLKNRCRCRKVESWKTWEVDSLLREATDDGFVPWEPARWLSLVQSGRVIATKAAKSLECAGLIHVRRHGQRIRWAGLSSNGMSRLKSINPSLGRKRLIAKDESAI